MIPFPFQVGGLGLVAPPSALSGVNTDDFSSNTLPDYTLTQDSGSPVAQIVSGKMEILAFTAPTNAALTRNTSNFVDGYVEVETDSAYDSGIIARFQNNANYYLLGLSDDSGISATNNMTLYKKIAGTYSVIGGPVNITWTRGTMKTFRLTVAGTSIQCHEGGVLRINVTDNSITLTGKAGMRGTGSSGGSNCFDVFRWT